MKWRKAIGFIIAAVLLLGWGHAAASQAAWADIQEVKPKIALTFDDGPHPIYTPKLLDGLKERKVKATFFVVGKNIVGNEEIIKRMDQEGHLIGNHTFSHVQLTKMKKEDACREVQQTNERICAVTGAPVLYIRPPYGSWNDELQAEIPMTVTLWNLDSEDWKSQNTGKIVELVESEAKEGSIILLHDIFDTSVEAALRIVDDLTAQGYTFVTVDELLLD